MVAPTGQEKQYYDQLFDAVSKDNTGLLPGSDALPFLTASGLPQQTLGEIWGVADPNNNGFLTRDTWYKAARLVGWLQEGQHHEVDASLAAKPGPYPTFTGYPPPPTQMTPSATPLSAHATGETSLPPLTGQDKAQFTRIFVGCEPINGLVSGDKARDVFMKSKLSYDKLGQIWALADTQERGALDLPDFIVGMWLIRISMANPSLKLPSKLPPGVYEAASGGRPAVGPMSIQHTGPTSPIQRQMTGTLQPQMTGQSLSGATSTPPRSNATPHYQSFPANATGPSAGGDSWDVTKEAKATYDGFFRQLDKQNKGVIEGDVAVPFMLQSQLDQASLGQIWELADIRQEGKLDPDEFAVAMYLINSKLAGKDLPSTLPTSLIPPSLRSTASGSQLHAPSSTSKDLFDLFDDVPSSQPLTGPATAAFLPQPPSRRGTNREPVSRRVDTPPKQQSYSGIQSPPLQVPGDLLGDDAQEPVSHVPDTSADVGNKKNELANTSRSMLDLQRTRSDLEGQQTSNTTQLEQLESELTQARAKYEEETKTVSELRIKVGEQTAKLRQLQADVISAQSDLTAKKMEKDELEQAYLRDKEEVRGLQKRMKEIEDEKTGLKLLLEKFKKDARQQKGMVSIAKKQLSTAEGSRDSLQGELREVENTGAEEVDAYRASEQSGAVDGAATRTRALSPDATGASQRSLNPFERLSRNSQSNPVSSPTGSFSDFPSFPHPAATAAGGATAGVATVASVAQGDNQNNPSEHSHLDSNSLTEAPGKDVDAFGMPIREAAPDHATDPFGGAGADQPVSVSGFGDSFASAAPAPAAVDSNKVSDFDATFADLEGPSDNVAQTETSGPRDDQLPSEPAADSTASAAEHTAHPDIVNDDASERPTLSVARPDAAERSVSTQAVPPTSLPPSPPSNDKAPALEKEGPSHPTSTSVNNGEESSDEDEGPEDIDGPRRSYTGHAVDEVPSGASVVSTPVPVTNLNTDEGHTKARRSAPPPPVGRSTSASSPPPAMPGAFASSATQTPVPSATATSSVLPHAVSAPQDGQSRDPFGIQETPAAPTGTTQKTETFDDDDFDFSDQPPTATVHDTQPPAMSSAFDDEFATFDEEFEKTPSQANNGSDNSGSLLQTYEVVPSQQEPTGHVDEWGLNNVAQQGASDDASGLSFEDAFGGAQKTLLATGPHTTDTGMIPSNNAAAEGAAPTPSFEDTFSANFAPNTLANAAQPAAHSPVPPALPERPPTKAVSSDLPQDDDLEDVKRLCAMGFPRSLVVEALDANGYDFQKALNVLLVK